MSGFASIDDLIAEITVNGKYALLPFIRMITLGATSVAGRWVEALAGGGTGGAMVLTGTAGLGAALSDTTVGALPLSPAAVSTDLRYLLTMLAITSSSVMVPGLVMLADLMYIYPSLVVTGTPTTLNNGAAKPTRMGAGAGVQLVCIVTSVLGATTPSLTFVYTNSASVGSRSGIITTPIVSLSVGHLLGGGVAANLLGPFMPLQAGDAGINQLDSYTIGSGTTGTVAAILINPLALLPIVAANTAGERDFLFQMPSLPKIEDNACLGLFVLTGGALTTGLAIQGSLSMAWG